MTIEQLLNELFFLSANTGKIRALLSTDEKTRDFKITLTKGCSVQHKNLKKALLEAIKTIRENREINTIRYSKGAKAKLYTFTLNKKLKT